MGGPETRSRPPFEPRSRPETQAWAGGAGLASAFALQVWGDTVILETRHRYQSFIAIFIISFTHTNVTSAST